MSQIAARPAITNYAFPLSVTFTSETDKPARETLFFMPVIKRRATPDDWADHVLEQARLLGFFPKKEPRVIMTSKDSGVSKELVFHFKKAADKALFENIAIKPDSRLFATFETDTDQPLEKIDVYIEVIGETCKSKNIDVELKRITDHKISITANKADAALYNRLIPEIVRKVNERWSERLQNLRQAGYEGYCLP